MSLPKNIIPAFTLAATLAVVAAGCGGQAYRAGEDGNDSRAPSSQGGGLFPGSPGSGTGGTGGTGDPIPPGTPDFTPTLTDSSYITGASGTRPSYTTGTINTDSIIKVRITAGPAGQVSIPSGTYSNYSASYYCVKYNVTVLGQTVTTNALSVNGGGALCPQAADNQVIDFSSRLIPGHGPVTVRVSSARYDYYCQLLMMGYISPYYWQTYCSTSLYPLYQTHTATFTLDIQTNGAPL
jgi:hypothetical protein